MKLGPPLAIALVLGTGVVPACVCSKSDEQPARPQSMQNPTPVGVQRPIPPGNRVLRLGPVHAVPVIEAGAAADQPR